MENKNIQNYLIVESQNDKFFLNALIAHLNLSTIEVSNATICKIDDYECMEGLNVGKISSTLGDLKDKFDKRPEYFNVGIVIDWDGKPIAERLKLINDAIKTVFNTKEELTAINQFITVEEGFQIACYFNGIDEQGELETVLKAIKSQDSKHADCLDSWRKCLEPGTISQKDFDKFWVAQYIRYDTCVKKERNQVVKNCTFEPAMKKPIWDFEHDYLTDLRTFLRLF